MKKVALVLGGGGSKAFSYLGAMDVFQKHGLKIDHIISSSSGSLMGILLANQIPISKIKEEFYHRGQRWHWIKPSISRRSIISQHRIRLILKHLLPQQTVENTAIPIAIVATNLNSVSTHIFTKGDALTAVCASSAYPVLYKPVLVDGKFLMADGGILNNLPADIAREIIGHENIVITLSAASPFDESLEALKTSTEIAYRIYYAPIEKLRNGIAQKYSDFIIEPFSHLKLGIRTWKDIFNFFHIKKLEEFYELGKQAAEKNIKAILEKIHS